MKKFSGLKLLFVVVILLGGYTYFTEFYKKEKDEKQKTEESKIFLSVVKDQVNQITVTEKKSSTVIERSADGWQIVNPIKDIADDDAVETFLTALMDEKSRDLAKEGEGIDDKTYGFGESSAFISLKSTAGALEEVEVSQQKNFEGNIFLRRKNEKKVYVVGASWLEHIRKKSADFRDKRFLRARIAEARKIEIQNQNGVTKLELKDGKWQSSEIAVDLLDQNRIREVLSTISDMKAQEILSTEVKDKTKHGFQSAAVKIKLDIKVKSEDKVWIGELSLHSDKKSVIATNSFPGYVVKFDKTQFEQLNEVSLLSLRDHRKPFNFDKSLVKKMTITTPIKKFNLTASGSGWSLNPDDTNVEVQQTQVKDLVDRLRTFEATHFLPKSDWKNFKNENQIHFEGQDGKLVFDFLWGQLYKKKINNIEKNIRYAKTSLSDEVFIVEESNFERLNLSELVKAKEAKTGETNNEAPKTEEKP